MNNQVLSIEQMNDLQDIGVDASRANIFWCVVEEKGCDPFLILTDRVVCLELVPTFTLQDMLDLLPQYQLVSRDGFCTIKVDYGIGIHIEESQESTIDAVYSMLYWIAENDFLNK